MKMNLAGREMKRTAAMLLCSVALALPALAQSGTAGSGPPDQTQGPPPGGGMGGRRGGGIEQRLARMQQELSLTPDQSVKIKAILEDRRAKMMAERDSSASQGDRRAKMMEMRKSEMASIKALLTEDQKVKFDAMEKQQMERMRGRGNGPPPPPPPPPPQ